MIWIRSNPKGDESKLECSVCWSDPDTMDYTSLNSALSNNWYSGWDNLKSLQILAVLYGENDGPEWHWLCLTGNNKLIHFYGGCDYTGWDCSSSLSSSEEFDYKDMHLFIPEYTNDMRPIREEFNKPFYLNKFDDLIKNET